MSTTRTSINPNSPFGRFIDRKTREYGARFTWPLGYETLRAVFDESQTSPTARYEVDVYGDGSCIERGHVGMTTGWAPSFLLVHRRNALGSSTLLDSRSKILRKVR